MGKIAIEFKNVSKILGYHQVLSNVNISLREHRITGIVGRNGSGKTVLLKCICGFLQPDVGEITIYGKSPDKYITEGNKLGAAIDGPALLDGYSGLRNLELLYGILNKPDRSHLSMVMERVGLDPWSSKAVKKYSMGMKQRLAIAQAIMEDQEIIILDEPMNGLDTDCIDAVRTLLLELKQEHRTIILSSHNQKDIELLCDDIYEIKEGRIL